MLNLIGRYKSGILCFVFWFVSSDTVRGWSLDPCRRKVLFGNRCQEQVRDMLRFSLVQVGDRCQHL